MNDIATAPNFRMIGGQRTIDGRLVRQGLVYRSDVLLRAAGRDAVLLGETGIRLVCDLRTAGERAHAPNSWWQDKGAELLNVDLLTSLSPGKNPWDLLRSDPTRAGADAIMCCIYAGFPAAALSHLAGVFNR